MDIKNQTATDELNRMKELISFGVNESKANNDSLKPIVEYDEKGADGKNYAIVREQSKYYIKYAPQKNTELLAEDYDYIGGFNRRKGYDSYNVAYKQFELKMKSLNEAYAKETKPVFVESVSKQSDWQVAETKEMREAINRIQEISYNVDNILSEGSYINKAYGDTVGKGTDEWTNDDKTADLTKTDLETGNGVQGAKKPIKTWTDEDKDAEYEEEFGGVKTTDTQQMTTGYTEKPNKTVKLTEEQVLAWSQNKDYMDKSKGTKVGSSAPYEEDKHPLFELELQDDDDVILDFDLDDDSIILDLEDDYTDGDDDDNVGLDFNDNDIAFGDEDISGPLTVDDDINDMVDDIIQEMILNDFGKHPAYGKEPFTLDANRKEPSKTGRRWDNEENLNGEIYGQEIGHNGDPYTEEVVKLLTDAIMGQLQKKK